MTKRSLKPRFSSSDSRNECDVTQNFAEQFVRFDAFQSAVSVMSHRRQSLHGICERAYFTNGANALRLPSNDAAAIRVGGKCHSRRNLFHKTQR
jgi:phosphoserine aminotransferase